MKYVLFTNEEGEEHKILYVGTKEECIKAKELLFQKGLLKCFYFNAKIFTLKYAQKKFGLPLTLFDVDFEKLL